MIQFKLPQKCKECTNIRLTMPTGKSYFCAAKMSGFVDLETRPGWCPIDKMNESLRGMTAEKRKAFKEMVEGMNVIFGSTGFGTGCELVDIEDSA